MKISTRDTFFCSSPCCFRLMKCMRIGKIHNPSQTKWNYAKWKFSLGVISRSVKHSSSTTKICYILSSINLILCVVRRDDEIKQRIMVNKNNKLYTALISLFFCVYTAISANPMQKEICVTCISNCSNCFLPAFYDAICLLHKENLSL